MCGLWLLFVMAGLPMFDDAHLEAVCNVLGDTDHGLTGSEIGKLLARCSIPDPDPAVTKRHRLFSALQCQQARDRAGNVVLKFVEAAMPPALYVGDHERFESRRSQLNMALSFAGITLGEDGKARKSESARTITEAEQRADRLRVELRRRGVHHDVLRFCRAELLAQDYFHAVLEATKSLADKLRRLASLETDGSRLVDDAFGRAGGATPRLAINSLRAPSEESEHNGFMNLIKGVFSAFRNPTAHEARIHWPVAEQDALDLLSMLSYVHRRLDNAIRTGIT